MTVGATNLISQLLKGLTMITDHGSGQSSIEWLMKSVEKQGAFGLPSGANPVYQQEVADAAQGPLLGEGAGRTWTSLVGQQVPLVGFTAALGGAGGGLAKILGAGSKGIKAAEIASGALGFADVSTGAFLQQAEAAGIDEDIRKKYALPVGVINGAAQEATMLAGLGPLKRAMDFTVGKLPKTGAVQAALKELGLLGSAGANMAGMDIANVRGMDMAVAEMKARHGEQWEPPVDLPTADPLRAFGEGVGLTAITRGAGRTVKMATYPVQHHLDVRQGAIDRVNEITKIMEDGGSWEDVRKPGGPEIRVDPAQMGNYEYRIQQGMRADEIAQALDNVRKSKPLAIYRLAVNNKISVKNEAGIKRSVDDLVGELKSLAGGVQEGPYMTEIPAGKGKAGTVPKLVISEPILNVPKPEEITLTNRMDKELRRWAMAKDLTGVDPRSAETIRNKIVFDAREAALREAGLSPEIANHPDMNNVWKVDVNKGDQDLASKLTRQQLAKYRMSMEGSISRLASEIHGKLGEATVRPNIYYHWKPPKMEDAKGRPLLGTDAKKLPLLSMAMNYIRPNPWPFIDMANKTGINFMGFDHGLMMRKNQENAAKLDWAMLHSDMWKKLPKELTYGTSRSALRELTMFMMESPEHRDLLVQQLGVKAKRQDQARAMAQRVVDAAKGKKWIPFAGGKEFTVDEVMKHGADMATKYKGMFDWFARSGAISFDKYRKNYVPVFLKFNESSEKSGMSFSEYAELNRKDWEKSREFSKKDVDEMISFADTFESLKQKGFRVPGESTPAYEYMRAHDREFMKMFTRDTNIEDLIDNYTSRYFKKIYFEDAIPAVRTFLDNTFMELKDRGVDESALKQMMTGYLDDLMGIPGPVNKTLQSLNLRTDKNEVGRVINNFAKFYNDTWGHKRLGAIPEKITPTSLSDAALTAGYAWFLGLPNLTSPLKNIATQNVAASMLGLDTWAHGLMALKDPARRQEIRDYGLRSDVAVPDYARMAHGRFKDLADFFLSIYQLSETEVNVAGSASTAMYAFDRLKPYLVKDPKLQNMTKAQFDTLVFKGWMDRRKVKVENTPASERMAFQKEFESAAPRMFQAVSTEMFDMIRKGKSNDARRMLVQNIVDMAQYRYGHGGSARMMKNPLGRMLGMFMTWPLNYIEMNTMMMNPKNQMVGRWLSMQMAQLAIAGVLVQAGFNAVNWVGTGALPEKFGFFGPVAQLLSNLMAAVKSSGEVVNAELIAGDAEQEKAHKQAKKAYEQIFK
jgi:hypothetical protein